MAITNRDRVGKALDLLKEGLGPFVEREFVRVHRKRADEQARLYFNDRQLRTDRPIREWDAAALLGLMSTRAWGDVFAQVLGHVERSHVSELRDARNKWAHQEQFTGDDTERALDTAARLLTAISAEQAAEVAKMRQELRLLVIDEQTRSATRRAGGSLIEPAAAESLKPWREVVTPHVDVASGGFQQAEFAADLWQVHLNEGSDEYRDPVEFFRRTYPTESLQKLLVGGIERLTQGNGDPVVQLQTNFGGGKTHSMLALYHLFSGVAPSSLPGIESLLSEAGVTELPSVRRAVLVGNKISPGNPVTKSDGTVVRTLWGEIAWQLGGAEAFARIAADDERASNPGDRLRELFNEYGPCLILVDEWVAYARQLHDEADLPGGDFETHFTFAQALTEAARSADKCLLLISLPASDGPGSSHSQSEDIEVGGIRGREALQRLRNVIGRIESAWRPATAEESFEIVRRRLFDELSGDEQHRSRNLTARAFSELYNKERDEFPLECRAADYERRIQSAYPIHPEIFDRLYSDWSTLANFQRTRGVLRLMAAVIHSLWEKGDRNPLILPSTIPIDDARVQSELTRYLSDNWTPIIAADVDGPNSLPLKIDNEVSNLGKLSATRRAARTIYLGSAPSSDTSQRGIEDRRVKLGCVMPGESPQVFGDAVRRLAAAATYLYQDGPRYWYATQQTVTKLADDRAQQLERDPDAVHAELERRLQSDLGLKPRDERRRGDFYAVHLMPQSGGDVPDQLETRLVVLDPEHAYARGDGNQAEAAAQTILQSRGSGPRLYRNTLAFLAADKVRLQDLQDAIRRYLAWVSILSERVELNLDPHQVRQAENQRDSANGAVEARLPETYCWVIVPTQANPSADVSWQASRLSGSDHLAVRASRKLSRDEQLVGKLGATIVRKALDDIPLWRGSDHVPVKTLVDDYAQQLYLPRLAGPGTLIKALRDGVGSLTWELDTFAYAESIDEQNRRYLGLTAAVQVDLSATDSGVIVKPPAAQSQLKQEAEDNEPPEPEEDSGQPSFESTQEPTAQLHRRYHGTVRLDPTRVGRDAGQIAQEIIAHLVGLAGADVSVTIDIEADLPAGASEHVVRTVTENGRTLKFEPGSGFERD
ncbi:MAG: Swt1 family HEPN domain-containing protein [Bryobacterales bacterium]|nr:Swt1 family HEPN domain-containing protein [Bryobacterales bacterium]